MAASPTRSQRSGRGFKHYFKKALIWVLVWDVLLFVAAMVIDQVTYQNGNNNPMWHFWDIVGGICIGVFGAYVIFGIFFIFGYLVYAFAKSLKAASVPIPSLPEIEAQLRDQGYDPTIQDVIAVEQHLRSNRNDALLGAAAAYGATRLLSGKSLF